MGSKVSPRRSRRCSRQTTVQTCIVHLIRNSLKYVPRREFADVTRDLKPIYTAIDADAAHQELERFDEKWGARFPVITQAWLDSWEYVTPFLAFPPEVRRVIYTTNAIEALNRQLRKAVKTKGHFPTEDAARKLLYLAIQNAVPAWTRTRNWTTALLAFKIHFGDRLPDSNPPTQLDGTPSRSTANRSRRGRAALARSCGVAGAVTSGFSGVAAAGHRAPAFFPRARRRKKCAWRRQMRTSEGGRAG